MNAPAFFVFEMFEKAINLKQLIIFGSLSQMPDSGLEEMDLLGGTCLL